MHDHYDSVVLDCDSTLSTIEGIDELARRANVYDECCKLTEAAMQGGLSLESIYAKRLQLIQPGRSELAWLGQHYIENLTAGAAELVARLQQADKRIYIISGGLLDAVAVMASHLNIEAADVFAVKLQYDDDGVYKDFDRSSPLARSGGKAEIIRSIKRPGQHIVCIGDGMTDLEMRMHEVDVIGFGGVKVREQVEQQADVYVADSSLLQVLPYILPH